MVPVDRRTLLRALGAGALAAGSGCATVREVASRFRGYDYRRDAPVEDVVGPWPTGAADNARHGGVDLSAPSGAIRTQEVTTVGRFADAQPAVVGDRAYVGVDRRAPPGGSERAPFSGLLAVDLDADRPGEAVEWRLEEGGPSAAYTPTVRGRVVYAQTGDGIRAVDATNGKRYWWTAAASGAPAVAGEDCYGYDSNGVVALDAVTGERRWTSETPVGVPQGVAVAGDAVVVACGDGGEGRLYCFERDDGSRRWRYRSLGESYATAVVDDEHAYAVNTDGELHAVDLAEGTQVWRFPVGGPSYAQPAVDDAVYVTSTNEELVAALDPSSGDVRWREDVGIGGMSPPALSTESVLFTTGTSEGNHLVVRDRSTGDERWRTAVAEDALRPVQPVVADGAVYVVAEPSERVQGSLYRVTSRAGDAG